jgi:hypothetical protein
LVEKIKRGGVLDQPWQLLTPEGNRVAFCGSSMFALWLSARGTQVHKALGPLTSFFVPCTQPVVEQIGVLHQCGGC